ncbi:MAG: glycosyltransferase family 2 protein [Bacteroidota bacterium]
MIRLSAVIITFNEERNIGRCIDSLKGVADEIIVVDSFSKDKTEEICKTKGAKFIPHAFEGYIQQKNFALELAEHPILLSLDADEALSDELRASILKVKEDFSADCYSFNRLTNYCGHWVRHGGWYPDRKLRLIRQGAATWGGVNPHDRLIPGSEARVAHIPGDLLHYSYYSVEEHDRQIEKFSAISAESLYKAGKRSSALKIAVKPVLRFFRDFVLKTGFLDGSTGWTIALRSYKAARMKYVRLMEYQQKVSP